MIEIAAILEDSDLTISSMLCILSFDASSQAELTSDALE